MIQFGMVGINVEQFAILTDAMPPVDEINVSATMNMKYSMSARRIALTITFSYERNHTDKMIIISVCCEFAIEETGWESMKKDGEIRIPKEVLRHLAVHTVGTTRGILHCKTSGTPFNSLILPPINVEEMIQEDISLPIEDNE